MLAEKRPTPVVTIGMPVYNGELFVGRAIEAILAQTFENFELIISDNASTDRTFAICQEYAARDPRIILLRNERNRGVVYNFNRVLAPARGKYFKAMSCNDLICPEFLQTGLDVLNSNPDVVLFYTQVHKVDKSGRIVGRHHDGFQLLDPDPIKRFATLQRIIKVNNPMYGLIRVDALRATSFLRPTLSADMVAVAELSLIGKFVQHDQIMMSRRMEDARGYTDADYIKELAFVNGEPEHQGPIMVFWRLCWEYTKVVFRSPISVQHKVRLMYYVAKNWFWTRARLFKELKRLLSYWFAESSTARSASKNAPTVTIGIPVFNGENHLEQAVESILAQTYTNFELIISDNASTDRTESICRDYAAKDSRIRYVRNEKNRGVIYNINQLVNLSRGKYFKYSSCNDYVEPEFLEKAINTLENQPDVVLCYGRTTLVETDGSPIEVYDDQLNLMESSPEARFQHLIGKIRLNNALEGVIRIDRLRETSFHGDYVAADIVAMGELALRGKFMELPQKLQYRRMDREGSTLYKSGKELQLYLLGQNKRYSKELTFWRLNSHHLFGIWRSPISYVTKLKLSWFLFKNLYWNRQVLTSELARAGLLLLHSAPFEQMNGHLDL